MIRFFATLRMTSGVYFRCLCPHRQLFEKLSVKTQTMEITFVCYVYNVIISFLSQTPSKSQTFQKKLFQR